jgi:NAD(P)-dependent dehydrogenase (short-subunit alcohol dehydrogenase family)/acyl carrier protein
VDAEQQRSAAASPAPAPLRLDWVEVGDLASVRDESQQVVEVELDATTEDLAASARSCTARCLALLQEWIGREDPPASRLVLVTRGAVSVADTEVSNLGMAPLWGLVRAAQAEHPGRFGLVDIDDEDSSRQHLPDALAALAEEPHLAIRQGRVLAPRLLPVGVDGGAPRRLDPDSTVLVTGGASGLLGVVVRDLVKADGARRLLFACRDDDEAVAAEAARAELEQEGCDVRVQLCDAADREDLRALLDSIPSAHPLSAVVHGVQALADGVLESLDAERLDQAMRPKLDAAWNLHELTASQPLSRFLMLSSAAGLVGGAGQANYAAASSFLDALAGHRRARGMAATSLAWGWVELQGEDGGPGEAARARLGRAGFAPLSAERARALLERARASEEPLLAVVELEAATLRAQAREGVLPAVLQSLVRVPPRPGGQRSLASRLATVAEEERPRLVLAIVREHVAVVLGHRSVAEVDPDRAFGELGLDSLTAVELRNRLGVATGMRLAPTLAFDYPTPAELAAHLAATVSAGGGAGTGEDGVDGVLAELEATLGRIGDDRRARERVGERLRAALAALAAADADQGEEPGEDLATLSDDEVFALIDEELGDG